jgi:SAM-dependent methyltransferase
MQERHLDHAQYFREQTYTTEKYVIPFINRCCPVDKRLDVLEIGCGHGGNLKPFLDLGCRVTGIDLSEDRIAFAKEAYREHPNLSNLSLICKDVYRISDGEAPEADLIVMKDVIEHIHDQARFMRYVRKFLKPRGRIFLGFPPWYMPFGGHQQVCESGVLSITPYLHLLPTQVYKLILRTFGEKKSRITELIELRSTGITIERFRKIVRNGGYDVENEQLFLVNPNYEIKFGLKPRNQSGFIGSLYFIRNFLTSCCYYLIRKN